MVADVTLSSIVEFLMQKFKSMCSVRINEMCSNVCDRYLL